MFPTDDLALGDPCLIIFLRLADLGIADLEPGPCVDLVKKVLTDLQVSGRISDCRDLVLIEEDGSLFIRFDVSWNRGFQRTRFECLKSALTPELGKIAEIMYS